MAGYQGFSEKSEDRYPMDTSVEPWTILQVRGSVSQSGAAAVGSGRTQAGTHAASTPRVKQLVCRAVLQHSRLTAPAVVRPPHATRTRRRRHWHHDARSPPLSGASWSSEPQSNGKEKIFL